MRHALIFAAILISSGVAISGQHARLFPIRENGKWGYMDSTAKLVIHPKYYSASTFREGLAAVRVGGRYGYIDENGRLVIAARYDFAEAFDHGIAKVYIASKPFFIDTKAKILFQHNFAELMPFGVHGCAIARTKSDRYCIVNRQGRALTDTCFSYIRNNQRGLFVVCSMFLDSTKPHHSDFDRARWAIIDSSGRFIVPFGLYSFIGTFHSGYASATPAPYRSFVQDSCHDQRSSVVLDSTGYECFHFRGDCDLEVALDRESLNDGLIDCTIRKTYSYKTTSNGYKPQQEALGIIGKSGDLLCSATEWEKISPCSCGRFFTKDTSGAWTLRDLRGHKIGKDSYSDIALSQFSRCPEDGPFLQGIAFVQHNNEWFAIDTLGNVRSPRNLYYTSLSPSVYRRHGDYLSFLVYTNGNDSGNHQYYGLLNVMSGQFIAPIFEDINLRPQLSFPLAASIGDTLCYIDCQGRIVWREKLVDSCDGRKQLNIDYMNNTCYSVSRRRSVDIDSSVTLQRVPQREHLYGKLAYRPSVPSILLLPIQPAAWQRHYKGFKLLLVNDSAISLVFDSWLDCFTLIFQAINEDGQWADIERLTFNSYLCGNAHKQRTLDPHRLVEFEAPLYGGVLSTKIRAVVDYKESPGQVQSTRIYSNVIPAHINPGQFLYRPQNPRHNVLGAFEESDD